jgi:enterochelin esterase-like enzyme
MPNLGMKDNVDRLIDNNAINELIIVMPEIDNSFGINTDKIKNLPSMFSAGKYEDYIISELIPFIDKNYRTIPNRNGRYIGGLSMGGWAALHLAFIHDDMFSKVGGHSPALINDNWIYPNFEERNKKDPILIALNKDLKPLSVYLDCGNNDSFKFYEGCEELYKALQSKGITSEYHLNSGGHDDGYWKENIDNYLLFYSGK